MLNSELVGSPKELARIVTHELYHFAWIRLGNAERKSYEALLRGEILMGESGELGWSSERVKKLLRRSDVRGQSRRWKFYVCESFCDTAAWIATGGRSGEVTLGARARRNRRAWFRHLEALGRIQL